MDMGTPSPDPRHTHRHPRGQPVCQTAAPEGLGAPCPPPLTYGQDVRVPGSLAGRVASLTTQNRAVTCNPDTLPHAQQAGQRLPPEECVPGREGPPRGAAGGLDATFPAAQTPQGPGQEADPALLSPGVTLADSGPWATHQGKYAPGAAPRDGRTWPARHPHPETQKPRPCPPRREDTARGTTWRPPRSHCPHVGPCEREPRGPEKESGSG